MRLKHTPIVILSGCLWLFVGVMLLSKGLNLIIQGTLATSSTAWIPFLSTYFGDSNQAGLALIVSGLFVGFLKGRIVLSKSANRVVERLLQLPEPVGIKEMYSRKYYILLLTMVGLGMSMRWLPIPVDVKGWVDTAVGSALMNGSLFYFRTVFSMRKQKT